MTLVWYTIAFLALFLSFLGSVVVSLYSYLCNKGRTPVVVDMISVPAFLASILLAMLSLSSMLPDIAHKLGAGNFVTGLFTSVGMFLGIALVLTIMKVTYSALKQVNTEKVNIQSHSVANEP